MESRLSAALLPHLNRNAWTQYRSGGLTVVVVPDIEGAKMWVGRLAEACGWPQEVRRFKPLLDVS